MSTGSPYIVGRGYDAAFFLAAPIVAVAVGGVVMGITGTDTGVDVFGSATTIQMLCLRTLIHAHLVIVLARSHFNRRVFARTPARFVVVPVVALFLLLVSPTLLALSLGVVIVWDLVHSSLQTFGLGRIYESRAGGDPSRGRAAELWLNHAIYLGPFLAGPVFLLVVGVALSPLVATFPQVVPLAAAIEGAAPVIRVVAVVASVAAVVVYVVVTVRAVRAGAAFSVPKHVLYASTAIACVAAWGFNSFGQALLIVNVFHAVQYFGLVAWLERGSLADRLRLGGRHAGLLVFAVLVLAGLLYGFWLGAAGQLWLPPGAPQTVCLAVVNLVALLHFWYDGFIWSVRRGDTAPAARPPAPG